MGNDNHEQMNQQEGRQSRNRKAIFQEQISQNSSVTKLLVYQF